MNLANFIILISSLIICQVSCAPRAPIDDAEALLAEFKEIVQGSHDSGLLKLSSQYTEYLAALNTVEIVGRNEILQEIQDLTLRLDTIKDIAAINSVDISSCLETTEEQFRRLLPTTVDRLESCIFSRGGQIEQILNRGIYETDQTLTRAAEVEAEFEECRVQDDNESCLAEVIEVIRQETQELPALIIRIVNTVLEYLDFSMETFGNCPADQIARLNEDAEAIFGEIQQCIDQLP